MKSTRGFGMGVPLIAASSKDLPRLAPLMRSDNAVGKRLLRDSEMTDHFESLQHLLERCITENTSEAWSGFFSAFRSLIQRVYHAHADAQRVPEFESWLPGWLYYERKLHAAYRAVRRKVESGDCKDADAEDLYIRNYIARIVRSAIAEFAREQRPKTESLAPESFLDTIPAAPHEGGEELHTGILEALQRFPPELRIPFWLRYYAVFGPLSGTDEGWVTVQTGLPADRIAEMLLQQADANPRHQKPLSSEFIGSLLNIPPCTDGRYSTVDQRVRRAIVRIREHVAQAAKENEEGSLSRPAPTSFRRQRHWRSFGTRRISRGRSATTS